MRRDIRSIGAAATFGAADAVAEATFDLPGAVTVVGVSAISSSATTDAVVGALTVGNDVVVRSTGVRLLGPDNTLPELGGRGRTADARVTRTTTGAAETVWLRLLYLDGDVQSGGCGCGGGCANR